jgi:predicted AlkP superfamily phosphohydrolase/phosphomutase
MINYYVDPGSGFLFTQNPSFLWAILFGFFGGSLVFFRFFFRFIRRFFRGLILLLLIILISWGLMMLKSAKSKKVIVIGIDAMDTDFTEKLMDEGALPNFSRLKREGNYGHLATTVSSETPVVWSSIATGLNPGGHGIFDFVMRHPENYSLYLGLDEITNRGGKIDIHRHRKGEPFWDTLSRERIPSFIYFFPNTFPPDHIRGRMLSGMGVPDILGLMGRYSFYVENPPQETGSERRGRAVVVKAIDGVIATYLYGPRVASGNSEEESTVPLQVMFDRKSDGVTLKIGGRDTFLKLGEWSGWQRVSFKVGSFKSVNGIVKFYLKRLHPDFQLYASPINFDPEDPPFPVSYPDGYAKNLVKEIGLYYTQGMPYDTWALTEGALDEKSFLEQADEVFGEYKNILAHELKEFKNGLFFFYFETADAVQHMFWRYTDPRSPLYEKNSPYQDAIFEYYRKMDALIGDVLQYVDKDTVLIVLSDHGFTDFRRAVNLNRWLADNGFLFLKGGGKEGKEFFKDVDWSRSKAYSLGFGGIYLNKKGREGSGIVSADEAEGVKKEIIAGLKGLRDPIASDMVIKEVYDGNAIYSGPYVKDAPDLFVGFNTGYRASWQTALGGTPARLIEDNAKKWSGDHLQDPSLVPGVIFINRNKELKNPSVLDIAPTILALFGIDRLPGMSGRVLVTEEK